MKTINTRLKGCMLVLMASLSCNTPPQEAATAPDGADSAGHRENQVMIPAATCYAGQQGKDSFFLKTEVFPNVVTGSLSYDFYEKDRNRGTIEGTLKGDTLIADYTFTSEGKESVRQVAFLLGDSTATEGYGQMEEQDGKLVFKSLQELSFTQSVSLHKVPCEER